MTLDSDGRLPPGRHLRTVAEMRDLFVDSAPNQEERSRIMDAFVSWRRAILELLPQHQLWVDGGFTTHKVDVPSDVDVLILAQAADVNALPASEQALFGSLLTYKDPASGRKIQPMAGLVDAFVAFRSEPDRTAYWFDWWQRVKDEPEARKGFLVVKPGD